MRNSAGHVNAGPYLLLLLPQFQAERPNGQRLAIVEIYGAGKRPRTGRNELHQRIEADAGRNLAHGVRPVRVVADGVGSIEHELQVIDHHAGMPAGRIGPRATAAVAVGNLPIQVNRAVEGIKPQEREAVVGIMDIVAGKLKGDRRRRAFPVGRPLLGAEQRKASLAGQITGRRRRRHGLRVDRAQAPEE